MEILKLLIQPSIIAAVVSAAVSLIIGSVFKKERIRRYSVVFDDRYKAYKTIFRMLIEIEKESQSLLVDLEKGDWHSHASAINKINSTGKEIKRIAVESKIILSQYNIFSQN